MKRGSALLFALLLASPPPAVIAEDMTLEIISLRHRPVGDAVSILRPLVAPGGTVTGANNQLIIKTTPSNLSELKKVLDTLDRAPRQLLITVTQGSGRQLYRQDEALSGRYASGGISVAVDDPVKGNEGLVVSAGDEGGNIVRYRARRSEFSGDDSHAFSVRATEGYPAYIHAGQSLPLPARTEVVTPGGVIARDSIEYHDFTSGFYVVPRLNGDEVTLLVAPRLARPGPGHGPAFELQDIETTATGRLGEWLELGGIHRDIGDHRRQIAGSIHSQRQETGTVWIKVDEIK